jgi:energy-coupling factor transport system permease protein
LTLVIFGLLFAALPFCLHRLSVHIVVLLGIVAAGVFMQVPWRKISFLIPPLIVILIGASSWLLSDLGGHILVQIPTPFGVWRIGSDSVYMSVKIALRGLIRLTSFAIILGTVTPREALKGLTFLRVPRGIALAVVFTFAFWPYVIRVARIIVEAQEARGLEIRRGNRWKRIRVRILATAVPLLFVMLRRMKTITYALIVRGFGAPTKTTDFYWRPLRQRDWLLGLCASMLAIGAVLLDRIGSI